MSSPAEADSETVCVAAMDDKLDFAGLLLKGEVDTHKIMSFWKMVAKIVSRIVAEPEQLFKGMTYFSFKKAQSFKWCSFYIPD